MLKPGITNFVQKIDLLCFVRLILISWAYYRLSSGATSRRSIKVNAIKKSIKQKTETSARWRGSLSPGRCCPSKRQLIYSTFPIIFLKFIITIYSKKYQKSFPLPPSEYNWTKRCLTSIIEREASNNYVYVNVL